MQDIPWYGYVLITVSLAYWGWVGIKLVDLTRKYAAIAERVGNQDKTCDQRLKWMQEQDKTLAKLTGGQGKIIGKLDVMLREKRNPARPEHRAD